VLARRIVLEIDARQAPLCFRKKLVLIAQVLLVILKQDAIQRLRSGLLHRQIVDVRAPRQMAPTPGVPRRTTGLGEHVEIVRYLGQVIQIAAMGMPGQDLQWTPAFPAFDGENMPSMRFASVATRVAPMPSAQPWPIGQSAYAHGRHATG